MPVKTLASGKEKKYKATKLLGLTNKLALRSPTKPTKKSVIQSQKVLSKLKKYDLK